MSARQLVEDVLQGHRQRRSTVTISPEPGSGNEIAAAWRKCRFILIRWCRRPNRIADHWVSDEGQMHADLVGAAGLRKHFYEAEFVVLLDHVKLGDGLRPSATAMRLRWWGSRPMGASMMPSGVSGVPSTSAR